MSNTRPARPLAAGTLVPLVGVWACLGAPGCSASDNYGNPTSITDTSGARFAWTCDTSGCEASADGSTPPAATCSGGTDFYGYLDEKLVLVCAAVTSATGGWSTLGPLCRAVTCARDADCPQFAERGYTCRSGLCEAKDAISLDAMDAVALCMASIPRVADCRLVASDGASMAATSAVDTSCPPQGTSCGVPSTCRQL